MSSLSHDHTNWSGVERRSGEDRRRDGKGRLVYSRGPLILSLQIASVITSLLALLALILSVVAIENQISTVQRSRAAAARDSCDLITNLVYASTPPKKLKLAQRFLAEGGLTDCVSYGQKVVSAK